MWLLAGTVPLRSCSIGCTTTRQVMSTPVGWLCCGTRVARQSSCQGLGRSKAKDMWGSNLGGQHAETDLQRGGTC